MKITFEPKMGAEIYIAEDGDFCFEQEDAKVYLTIGQIRGLMKKMPELLKLADDKRTEHLRKTGVQ